MVFSPGTSGNPSESLQHYEKLCNEIERSTLRPTEDFTQEVSEVEPAVQFDFPPSAHLFNCQNTETFQHDEMSVLTKET